MTDQQILELATDLHKFYRAAFLSLHMGRGSFMGVGRVGKHDACRNEHDHGWTLCHKKKYFIKRAKMLLESPDLRAALLKVPF